MSTGSHAPRAWWGIALAVFTVAWGGNQYTPLLVMYRQDGYFGPVFIDLMLVSYAVGVAFGLLAAGSASDRYGRKRVMLPTPLFAALASLLIALGEHNGALMTLGRACSGIAVGIAMTAGGAWIKELSTRPYDPHAVASSGAKRAAMSLTAGFAVGPAVAGVLAQWVAMPGQLVFFIHIALSALVTPLMLRLPETRHSEHLHERGGFQKDMAIPSLKHPRFLYVVMPMAPWVFGAGFTAYAILPKQISGQVEYPIALSALVALVALGSGFTVQQFGPRIAGNHISRGPVVAMSAAVTGMGFATLTCMHPSVSLVLVSAVFLGLAYGLCAYIGLAETQAIATPDDMAGLSGIFYCLTYLGMLFPALLTMLSTWFSYPVMVGFGVVVAGSTLAAMPVLTRRHPAPDFDSEN